MFIEQPQETIYDVESPDSFTYIDCVADSLPNPKYEWYKERAGQVVPVKPEEDNRLYIRFRCSFR